MTTLFNPAAWAAVVLAWSLLLLLPFGRSSELPTFIMAILGGILIWRHGKQAMWEGGARAFSLADYRFLRATFTCGQQLGLGNCVPAANAMLTEQTG